MEGCAASISASGVPLHFAVFAIPAPGDDFQVRFANRLPAFFTDPKGLLICSDSSLPRRPDPE